MARESVRMEEEIDLKKLYDRIIEITVRLDEIQNTLDIITREVMWSGEEEDEDYEPDENFDDRASLKRKVR